MNGTAYTLILFLLCQKVCAQSVELTVEGTNGKRLHGVVMSERNLVIGMSDTSGIIKTGITKSPVRLSLAGYNEKLISTHLGPSKIIMVRNDDSLQPIKFQYGNPIELQRLTVTPNFDITPVDSLSPGDTVLEKVTCFNVKWPCVLSSFIVQIGHKKMHYDNFELVLYKEEHGKPGSSLLNQSIKGHTFDLGMAFNVFGYQIELNQGKYYIGYRKKINKLQFNKRMNQYYDMSYIDMKSSGSTPTFKKLNNNAWLPVLMPKSTIQKPKYYSFGYTLDLIKHN